MGRGVVPSRFDHHGPKRSVAGSCAAVRRVHAAHLASGGQRIAEFGGGGCRSGRRIASPSPARRRAAAVRGTLPGRGRGRHGTACRRHGLSRTRRGGHRAYGTSRRRARRAALVRSSQHRRRGSAAAQPDQPAARAAPEPGRSRSALVRELRPSLRRQGGLALASGAAAPRTAGRRTPAHPALQRLSPRARRLLRLPRLGRPARPAIGRGTFLRLGVVRRLRFRGRRFPRRGRRLRRACRLQRRRRLLPRPGARRAVRHAQGTARDTFGATSRTPDG